MHSKLRHKHRPGQHDQLPAAHNERGREQRPGAAAKFMRHTPSAAAGWGHSISIKCQFGATSIGQGTTMNFLHGATGFSLGNTAK
jgi:hypothetical protein